MEPLLLLLDEYLLLFLDPLVLDLLLGDELNCQLTGLLDDALIHVGLVAAGSGSAHDLVEQDGAGVHVVGLQQFLADPDLAPDDGVHVYLQDLPHHQLHLGGADSLLDQWVRGDVEVLLVHVLLGCVDCVSLYILVLAAQCLLECFRLLQQGLQLLRSDHCIDMCHITQGRRHKGR